MVASGITAPTYVDLAVAITPGTVYYYVIETVNVMGTSDDSSELAVHVTTPPGSDFDGDGKADVTVFRPSTGTWYVRGSTVSATYVWGGGADIPVPGDYDGDGKADVAVFRPSTGTWYIRYSATATYAAIGWGGLATSRCRVTTMATASPTSRSFALHRHLVYPLFGHADLRGDRLGRQWRHSDPCSADGKLKDIDKPGRATLTLSPRRRRRRNRGRRDDHPAGNARQLFDRAATRRADPRTREAA